MALPVALLQAVASPGGGKIALVVGAGCSVEAPTGVPVARDCSLEVYRRLVADGVLQEGDCRDPTDLSLVADAVFIKKQSQHDVVERLREQYDLKLATPNEGYLIAAAMLCEGVITSIVTLNFDLALSNALSSLGVGQRVGVIERPEDLPKQKLLNVYYLHRNANESDPELWVLRTATLDNDWRGHWQPIVATKVLAAPVVVFTGLGNPVAVLIESAKLVRGALPAAATIYQVDPGDQAYSKSFQALALEPAAYIRLEWGQFMGELSERLAIEQINGLEQAIDQKVQDDHLATEDVNSLLTRLRALGLVKLGQLRTHWLLYEKPYCPADPNTRGLIADLLLAIALMARVSGTLAIIVEDGLVEFQRAGRVVVAYLVVSGLGHRGRAAIEAAMEARRLQCRGRPAPPRGVIVAGTSDAWTSPVTPPRDVVRGDFSDDVVGGPPALPLFHVQAFREEPSRVAQVVP